MTRVTCIIAAIAACAIIYPIAAADTPPALEIKAHKGPVMAVKFSPDGKSLLSGGADGILKIWDPATGTVRNEIAGPAGGILCLAWTPDGYHAAAGTRFTAEGGAQNLLMFWHLPTKRHLRSFPGPSGMVRSIAFTPDGRHVLAACDGVMRIWTVRTADEVRLFKGHKGIVNAAALTPNAKFALSGGVDSTVRIWNVAKPLVEFDRTGPKERAYRNLASPERPSATFEGHGDSVTAVAVTPDGKFAVSASTDRTLRLWDIYSGRCIRVFRGHTDGVYAVAISPDGTSVLSGARDRTARLWDIATGSERRVFGGHGGHVYGVDFSPDGGRIATACLDGKFRIWKI